MSQHIGQRCFAVDQLLRGERLVLAGKHVEPEAVATTLLDQAAGLVHADAKTAKVIKTGKLEKPVKLTGVLATKGAKAAIGEKTEMDVLIAYLQGLGLALKNVK